MNYRYVKNNEIHCKGEEKYEKNKKDKYCKNCDIAILCKNGIVCPNDLNANW